MAVGTIKCFMRKVWPIFFCQSKISCDVRDDNLCLQDVSAAGHILFKKGHLGSITSCHFYLFCVCVGGVGGFHWYTHITRKVRVKEWERTPTLSCKGNGGVKPGSARPPDPQSLWCSSLQDMGLLGWGGEGPVWRGPGPALLPQSQQDSGTRLCPQRKCTRLWVGRVERSHTGISGTSKQTDVSDHFLRRCMDVSSPQDVSSWSF